MKRQLKISSNILECITFKNCNEYKLFFLLLFKKDKDTCILSIKRKEVLSLLGLNTRSSANKNNIDKIIEGFKNLSFNIYKQGVAQEQFIILDADVISDMYIIKFSNAVESIINSTISKFTILDIDIILSLKSRDIMSLYLFLSRIVIKEEASFNIAVKLSNNNKVNSLLWLFGNYDSYNANPRLLRNKFKISFNKVILLFKNYSFNYDTKGKMNYKISYKKIK